MVNCRDCGVELTGANWAPSYVRDRSYLCRGCAVKRPTNYVSKHYAARRRYNAKYYRKHKAESTERSKAYAKAHPDAARAYAKRWAQRNRPKATAIHRRYAQGHKQLLADRAKKKREILRAETLAAYGHICACCGETRAEFLAVDHTNGDGAAHRREIKAANGGAIYLWLKKRGFPKDRFRLLCHNCNNARAFYGYCPHERERTTP